MLAYTSPMPMSEACKLLEPIKKVSFSDLRFSTYPNRITKDRYLTGSWYFFPWYFQRSSNRSTFRFVHVSQFLSFFFQVSATQSQLFLYSNFPQNCSLLHPQKTNIVAKNLPFSLFPSFCYLHLNYFYIQTSHKIAHYYILEI